MSRVTPRRMKIEFSRQPIALLLLGSCDLQGLLAELHRLL
jgi:hypothetical protein